MGGKKIAFAIGSVPCCGAFVVVFWAVLAQVCHILDLEIYTYPRSSGARAAGKSTMRAATYERYGTPKTAGLKIRDDIPVPDYRSNDVLIRVHAASVNPYDWKMMGGFLEILPNWIKAKPPHAMLGQDLAGTVVAVGKDVTRFHKGDSVYATMNLLRSGAFAEFAVLREDLVSKKPKNTAFKEAAGLPMAGQAAIQAIRDAVPFKKDSTVFILGGTSAVGYAAITVARHLGASLVVATANEHAYQILHDHATPLDRIVGAGQDVISHIYSITSLSDRYRDGFEVVIDCVGGEQMFQLGLAVTNNKNGTFVTLVGDDAKSPVGIKSTLRTFVRTLSQWYLKLRKRGPTYKMFHIRPSGRDLNILRHLVEDRRLKPFVDSVYPLSKLSDALEKSMTGHAKGKLIIDMKPEK